MEIKPCKFLLDFSHKVLEYHDIDKSRADYIIDTLDTFVETEKIHDLFQDLTLLKGKFVEYHEYLAITQIMTALCIYNKFLYADVPKEELMAIIQESRLI